MQVIVERVLHLPKMDAFGTCDPYVLLKYGGREAKTSVKKGKYSASFAERFVLALRAEHEGHDSLVCSPLSLSLFSRRVMGGADAACGAVDRRCTVWTGTAPRSTTTSGVWWWVALSSALSRLLPRGTAAASTSNSSTRLAGRSPLPSARSPPCDAAASDTRHAAAR